jgi:hypothetical protein
MRPNRAVVTPIVQQNPTRTPKTVDFARKTDKNTNFDFSKKDRFFRFTFCVLNSCSHALSSLGGTLILARIYRLATRMQRELVVKTRARVARSTRAILQSASAAYHH